MAGWYCMEGVSKATSFLEAPETVLVTALMFDATLEPACTSVDASTPVRCVVDRILSVSTL